MRQTATKSIYAAWKALSGMRRMPHRNDLNPAAFGASLPHIFLLERNDGQISLRLAGSRLCSTFGEELRDHAFASLFSHASGEDVADLVTAVTIDGAPVIAGISALFPDRLSIGGEMLLLPLHFDGSEGEIRILGSFALSAHRPLAASPCVNIEIVTYRIIGETETTRLLPGNAAVAAPLSGSQVDMRRARFRVLEGGQARDIR